MTNEREPRNAIIVGASLSTEDFGVLTAWLRLDYGEGGSQSFGGFNLTGQNGPAGHFIERVLEVAGVTEWARLVGRTIRVRATHQKVLEIGHIVKNDWFNPTRDLVEAARG